MSDSTFVKRVQNETPVYMSQMTLFLIPISRPKNKKLRSWLKLLPLWV